MKYAKHINLTVDFPHLNKSTIVLGRHGKGLTDFPEGVIRKYIPNKQVDLIKSSLPEALQSSVIGVNYSDIRLLAPHIHMVEQAVINFYQHTNGEMTTFYEGEIERDDRWSTDNGNGYLNVVMEKIHPVESFIAKDNDVWILDTRQPHSVTIIDDERTDMHQFEPKGDNHRKIVQVYLDLPFAEVIKFFD